MTPMIDVVFLLIVFFMLVAQLSKQQRVELELAQLRGSVAERSGADERLVVNVLPGGGVRFAGRSFGDDSGISQELAESLAREAAGAAVPVVVRAAGGEAYARVHAVMQAAAEAGLGAVELAVDAEGRP